MKILFLENLPYQSHITVGSHHYARLFAKEHQILWLSLPWHIAQVIRDRKSDRIRNWNWNRVSLDENGVNYLTPFTFFPYRNNPVLRNEWFCHHQYSFIPGIRAILRRMNFGRPDLAWFSDPRHISILSMIQPKKIAYRCVDNLEEFSDVPRSLLAIEKELVRKSDAVFFTASLLKEKFSGLNPNSFHLPNGCDFEFFSNPEAPRRHSELFLRDKLNLLYTGAIAQWMDFEALELVAELDFVNLIMVGPLRTSIPESLKKRSNVTFTGPLPYGDMPGLVQQADAGFIPFLINKVTDYVDPIKLHEYCAGGLPCITSSFRTVANMTGAFYKYRDYEELCMLLRALKENRSFRYTKEEIQNFAMQNSGASRSRFVKEKLHLM